VDLDTGCALSRPLTATEQDKAARDYRQMPKGMALNTAAKTPTTDVTALPPVGGGPIPPVPASSGCNSPDHLDLKGTDMENNPRKCRRPSRCRHCAKDMRRGELIVYHPADAKPGQIEYWIHEGCAS
jgi:hypothetical protein